MSKYYWLKWKWVSKGAMALPPKEEELRHELTSEIEGKNILPFDFVLKKITKDDYSEYLPNEEIIWEDYLAALGVGFSLISERLKAIINAHLTGEEGIEWISCKVNAGPESRTYYVLRFTKKLDVLDMEKTLFDDDGPPDDVMRACFSFEKVKKYAVFTEPRTYDFWKIPRTFYVSAAIKKAAQKEKLIVGFEGSYVV